MTYNEIQVTLGCSKGTISYHLGEGQKDKAKERSTRKRTIQAQVFNEYKEQQGCIDCGESYPYWMLEFDHLPGHKKVGNPYQLAREFSLAKGWEEIAKCDVVCANCHKIRTYTRNPW